MPRKIKSIMFFYGKIKYTLINRFNFTGYVLQSKRDGKNYIGYTNDLRKRIAQHNRGEVFSTKSRRPLKLIYYEACLDKEDAEQREKYLKSTTGRRWLGKRLRNFNKFFNKSI